MTRANPSLNTIEDFLSHKRLAIVGLSRKRQEIGNSLFDHFTRQGYEVLPVNPNTTEINGRRCFPRIQDIQPAPDWVLLLTPPSATNTVVRDCAEAGIRRIWMYRGGGQGAVSVEAVEFCRAKGIEVVPGACPFMFLPPVRNIHWVHRCFSKLLGNFPRREAIGTA
jgi:predicted CoA-binding protein